MSCASGAPVACPGSHPPEGNCQARAKASPFPPRLPDASSGHKEKRAIPAKQPSQGRLPSGTQSLPLPSVGAQKVQAPMEGGRVSYQQFPRLGDCWAQGTVPSFTGCARRGVLASRPSVSLTRELLAEAPTTILLRRATKAPLSGWCSRQPLSSTLWVNRLCTHYSLLWDRPGLQRLTGPSPPG